MIRRRRSILIMSVQFKMVTMRSEKHNVLHPVSQTSFPNVAFGTVLMPVGRTRLIDDGPFSSFQRRSSSASSFHASLLQAINGVMSLALCPISSRMKKKGDKDDVMC